MMLTQNVKVIEDVLNDDWKKTVVTLWAFGSGVYCLLQGKFHQSLGCQSCKCHKCLAHGTKKTGVSFTEVESVPVRVERF